MCIHLCGITAEEADRREIERSLAGTRRAGPHDEGAVVSGGRPI
ncbi:hypothetical protein [Arthrobacter sp. CAN_A1]